MRMRATVAGLTSRAAPMAASVQLGPASPWLALSRMRAWVRALAGATPRPIMVCNQARSSSVRTTTCRLRTSASCSVGPPEPHEDEGQPPTTQLKADELLGGVGGLVQQRLQGRLLQRRADLLDRAGVVPRVRSRAHLRPQDERLHRCEVWQAFVAFDVLEDGVEQLQCRP